jgi:hypothetical protein
MKRRDFLSVPLASTTAALAAARAPSRDKLLLQSAADSVRFTVERTLGECSGHTCSRSGFVDAEGAPMTWHDFGVLEGPGWAANAVGGAYEIYRFGKFTGNKRYRKTALSILDHVLGAGFITPAGFIRPYRVIPTGEFVLNYRHSNAWLCPGSMAKIGFQLVFFADVLEADGRGAESARRVETMRQAAVKCAAWIHSNVKPTESGWFPRRTTATGDWYQARADNAGAADPLFDSSADPLFILQLMTVLSERRLANYRSAIHERVSAFINRGGIFGSINHDVYDPAENVAFAVAFRVLRAAARLLGDPRIRAFAFERCLAGLEQFKMREDRNGVATRGLLFMARSWDTAYLWENAEAAQAYLEAAEDTGDAAHSASALTILEAIAGHHHGPYGFLTEGVDWNNHVGAKHHFDGAKFGDIKYTEPFLNNLHIVEPTLNYLERGK